MIVQRFLTWIETAPAGQRAEATHALARAYLYSDVEIARLLDAARRMPQPFRGATYSTLFGLLAVTGLRIGEAIRLDRDDVDLDSGTLVVRMSKFGKSREVPVHATTLRALRGYAATRNQAVPRPRSPAFFLSSAGTRLSTPAR